MRCGLSFTEGERIMSKYYEKYPWIIDAVVNLDELRRAEKQRDMLSVLVAVEQMKTKKGQTEAKRFADRLNVILGFDENAVQSKKKTVWDSLRGKRE